MRKEQIINILFQNCVISFLILVIMSFGYCADIPTYSFDEKGNIIEHKEEQTIPQKIETKPTEYLNQQQSIETYSSVTPTSVCFYSPSMTTGSTVQMYHPNKKLIRNVPIIQEFDNQTSVTGNIVWIRDE